MKRGIESLGCQYHKNQQKKKLKIILEENVLDYIVQLRKYLENHCVMFDKK